MKTLFATLLIGAFLAISGEASSSMASEPDARKRRAEVEKEISEVVRILETILAKQEMTTRRLDEVYRSQLGGPLRALLSDEPLLDNNGQPIRLP